MTIKLNQQSHAFLPVPWPRALRFRLLFVSLRKPSLRCDRYVWADRSVPSELHTIDDERVLLLCATRCVTTAVNCEMRCGTIGRGITCSISWIARRSCFSWSTVVSRRLWNLSASSWTQRVEIIRATVSRWSTFVRCTSRNHEFNNPRSTFVLSSNSLSIAFTLEATSQSPAWKVSSHSILLAGHGLQITFRLLKGFEFFQHHTHALLSFPMTNKGVDTRRHRDE